MARASSQHILLLSHQELSGKKPTSLLQKKRKAGSNENRPLWQICIICEYLDEQYDEQLWTFKKWMSYVWVKDEAITRENKISPVQIDQGQHETLINTWWSLFLQYYYSIISYHTIILIFQRYFENIWIFEVNGSSLTSSQIWLTSSHHLNEVFCQSNTRWRLYLRSLWAPPM